jgi:hypothetical protein
MISLSQTYGQNAAGCRGFMSQRKLADLSSGIRCIPLQTIFTVWTLQTIIAVQPLQTIFAGWTRYKKIHVDSKTPENKNNMEFL